MKRSNVILVSAFIVLIVSACAANPKKKCNTCPKWTELQINPNHTPNLEQKA
jgi:hypothetical protein